MIVGRPADRRVDLAGKRVLGDLPCAAPAVGVRLARERSVAGEGELAAGRPGRALIDDSADAIREGRVADPVEDDLRDRALAVRRPDCRLRNRPRWRDIGAPGARAAALPLKMKGAAAGLGPLASGISALTLIACCGATGCRISGGGAGGAAWAAGPVAAFGTARVPIATKPTKPSTPSPDRLARISADERPPAVPPAKAGLRRPSSGRKGSA